METYRVERGEERLEEQGERPRLDHSEDDEEVEEGPGSDMTVSEDERDEGDEGEEGDEREGEDEDEDEEEQRAGRRKKPSGATGGRPTAQRPAGGKRPAVPLIVRAASRRAVSPANSAPTDRKSVV